jgi:ketosteroid isomerase-like protein
VTDVELVLGCYAAYASGNIDDAVAALHEDVEWIEPEEFPDGGPRRGRQAVAEYLARSRARWSELTVEPQAHERDGRIVIVVRHRGRLTSGVERDVTVADVFTVRDHEVVHMQAYANPAEALGDTSPSA